MYLIVFDRIWSIKSYQSHQWEIVMDFGLKTVSEQLQSAPKCSTDGTGFIYVRLEMLVY